MTQINFKPIPINVVERETGLTKDMLRKWESRYGYPQPLRTEIGERVYTAEDLRRLKSIKRLLDCGMRPGDVVHRPMDELAVLQTQCRVCSAEGARSGVVDQALDHLRGTSVDALKNMFRQLLIRQGLKEFVISSVAQLNVAVGSAWAEGTLSVFQEHFYTETLRNFLMDAIACIEKPPHAKKVLLSTPPEELHGLGLLMVQALFSLDGYECISLGTQTPATELAAAVAHYGADIVAVSISVTCPKRQWVPFLESLRLHTPETVQIWVGGSGVGVKKLAINGLRVFSDLDDAFAAMQAKGC